MLLVAVMMLSVVQDCNVVWQWFDNTRWCSYTSDMCQLIEKAYQDKESSVK